MTTTDWQTYFVQNRRDRRGVAWYEPVKVVARVLPALRETLGWLRRVEWRDARRLRQWTRGDAAELLVAEKEELTRWLDRLLDRLGESAAPGPSGMAFLTGPWSVAAVIVREAVLLRLYGTLQAAIADSVLQGVCDQVLHDKKFHIRFLCARRGPVPRGVLLGLGGWAVASTAWRRRALFEAIGVPWWDFVLGCVENLRAVAAALYAGKDFTRGAAEQVPPLGWPWPRARG